MFTTKQWKFIALGLVVLGFFGFGDMVEKWFDIPNVVDRDIIAIAVGLLIFAIADIFKR